MFGCRNVSVQAVSLSRSPPQHRFCTYNSKNGHFKYKIHFFEDVHSFIHESPHGQVINRKFEHYLCVIHESSSFVTWPDLNISHPAWAIIAPLSMQNLWQIGTVLLDGGGGSDPRWSLVRADGYRSSVANSLAPLSWHITPIISCRRRLPAKQKRR